MGSLLLLLTLCVIMAVASFLAGALPLSMTLSPSQLRLISSIGIGILVGTSLIVIIPEGIEAVAPHGGHDHSHAARALSGRGLSTIIPREVTVAPQVISSSEKRYSPDAVESDIRGLLSPRNEEKHKDGAKTPKKEDKHEEEEEAEMPTFYIGLSLILGFVLMFLIDRLPRHATERLQTAPPPREISLDSLGTPASPTDEESTGFLGSLTPSPKQSRGFSTTMGLVIHAAADGVAMGASSSTSNTKLGFIIFFAIMIHKAPAAFGLTSVLLKQGLSKRAARGHLLVFSLAAPAGALGTWFLIALLGGGKLEGDGGQWWTGMLLLFSAGTFLYVAMHAMQDDSLLQGHGQSDLNGYADGSGGNQRKQGRPEMRDTLATVGGMLLPLLTQFGHHH